MPDNPYDKTCRQLARRYPREVLLWLLALSSKEVHFVRWLDTRGIPSPWERERTTDTVAFLRDLAANGLPWALALEFQLDPDPLMFGRLLVYLGHIWLAEKPDPERGDRFCLAAVVVNLRGRGHASRKHTWPRAKLLTHLRAVDLNLQEQKAGALLGRVKAGRVAAILLALIPLMHGGDDPGILDGWFDLASAQTDENVRADLKAYAWVLAEAAGREDLWRPRLEEWNVIRSKVIDGWKAEEAAKLLVAFLEGKFGSLPADLIADINGTTDLDRLEQWVPLAARTPSLKKFRKETSL